MSTNIPRDRRNKGGVRKPRPDFRLFKELTEDQQALVAGWLQKESYDQVAKRIHDQFGITISESSLGSFWQRICSARLTERLAEAANQANQFTEALATNPADWDSAIIGQIKQKVFEMGATDKLTAKEITSLLSTYTALLQGNFKAAELRLQREKFEFDAAKKCLEKLPQLKAIAADSGLDKEAKLRAVREKLFGPLPT